MDFFTGFTQEKTPQNNFSSQNFSVENNYFFNIQQTNYNSMKLQKMEDIKNNLISQIFLPGCSGICLLGTEQKTEAAAASHPQERYIEKQQ